MKPAHVVDPALASAEPSAGSGSARGGGPRLLIIRPSALGDVSRTTPALVSLRRAFPDAEIDWLVNAPFAPAIDQHPDLDGVIPFDRKRLGSWSRRPAVLREAITWLNGLRLRRYDRVIDLQGLLRSGLFAWASRAPRRVGFANAAEAAWLAYTHRYPVDLSLHTVDRMLGLLEADGVSPVADLRLYASPEAQAWRDQTLLGDRGGPDASYAVLAPTARWASKTWPAERFAEVARRLLDSRLAGQTLVMLTGPGEADRVAPLRQALGERDDVLWPSTSVAQMMAILERASLAVCNDSAALHIAVGFGRPIVAIFGPTNPALVGPYRQDAWVVQPPGAVEVGAHDYRRRPDDDTLIRQVGVDEVWRRAEAALAAARQG